MLFADRITVRKATGFSPFYLLHGIEPLLPFDLTEASFMVEGFRSGLTTAELLALKVQQLEKRTEDIAQAAETLARNRLGTKEQFERKFHARLQKDSYDPGFLVLVRNSGIEKSLDKKTKPRYQGPFEIVRHTTGGSYVLQELDGSVKRQSVAAFGIIPYISRKDTRLYQLREAHHTIRSDDTDSSTPRPRKNAKKTTTTSLVSDIFPLA